MLFSKIVKVSSFCKKKKAAKRLKESDGSSKKLKNIHILNVVSDNPILPLESCTSGLVWFVSLLNRTPIKKCWIRACKVEILVNVDS